MKDLKVTTEKNDITKIVYEMYDVNDVFYHTFDTKEEAMEAIEIQEDYDLGHNNFTPNSYYIKEVSK